MAELTGIVVSNIFFSLYLTEATFKIKSLPSDKANPIAMVYIESRAFSRITQTLK